MAPSEMDQPVAPLAAAPRPAAMPLPGTGPPPGATSLSGAGARRAQCYYDGLCGLCTGWARFFGRLDWLGRLEMVDLTRTPDEALPVPREAALRGMPVRTRSGRVLVGFPAVRYALTQTPVGVVPGWALMVPGVAWLGRVAYDWFAARRRAISCRLGVAPRSDDRGSAAQY
ncbi:MAG: hypothetical protein C0468_01760 [Planctomyces sp.]|nr:hypothetical protein [Planctomyces sp.]MBA4120281.1 hypothetical protein [Isosphaera sp.]